ncbi:glycoside hydrolase family 5 protein [Xylariaceae sp. FL1272]|nr:glycoside hydrolase family 5 protein [Xylariaceae sp. FL1272]
MKTSILALSALALRGAVAATTWMGTNLYYLQGLSEEDQNSYIDTLADYGVKVVRLWANRQPGNSELSNIRLVIPFLATSIGAYNYETLDALDLVISKLAQKGMKVVISPHDGNSLIHGDYRADIYESTWPNGAFYTDSDARTAYKNRIDAIVNYQGATSGQVWKNWTDAILAFDLQNEPMCAFTSLCTDNDQAGWLCDIALAMRLSLGGDNPIKIATGSVGGDASNECITISAATSYIVLTPLYIAAHKYGGPQSTSSGQWSNSAASWLSASNGKLVFVEEWGANSALASQSSDFPAQADDIDAGGIPNLYWQFLPPQNSACPYDPVNDNDDHFGIYVNGDVDLKSAVQKANSATAKQDWSAIVP